MSTKQPLRKMVLGNDSYVWTLSHQHSHSHGSHEHACREIFTAYLVDHKAAPLRIYFSEEEAARVNLHEPKAARALIEAALFVGWTPSSARMPFVIEDGMSLLRDVQSAS